jgi:AcrR family transcriptional regulator
MNDTFRNLPPDKRERFLQAALIEFAANNFQAASVNRIIKRVGIARGSVYQYFDDKVDLWKYLKNHAENKKLHYLAGANREEYADFWAYYKELYHQGLLFQTQHPACSQLLHRIAFLDNSPEIAAYTDDWRSLTTQKLGELIEAEKRHGTISPANSTEVVTAFLMSLGMTISTVLSEQTATTDHHATIDQLVELARKALG